MQQQYREKRLFLALSRMVERDFYRHHQLPENAIRLVYNGVDTDRFHPDRNRDARQTIRGKLGIDGEVVFLIVAHNLRLKGLPTLLQSFARLIYEGARCRLVVVGGKRIASFERRAKSLGVSQSVAFEGVVDNAEEYYSAADVYVQPTLYDPCSLVVLEALSSGLPVITSSCNGAGELIVPGHHGFIVDDPQDEASLSMAMNQMMHDNQRRRMGLAARQLALRHSFGRNVDEILSVYNEVIDNGRGSIRRKRAA